MDIRKIIKGLIGILIIIFVIISIIIFFPTEQKIEEIEETSNCIGKITDPECLALAEKDETKCELMLTYGNEQDVNECKANYWIFRALQENRLNFCDNIKDETLNYGCNMVVREDPSYCEQIPDENFKQNCVAISTRKKTECEKITDEKLKLYCQQAIERIKDFNEIEITVEDCGKITKKINKQRCFGYTTRNIEYCNIKPDNCHSSFDEAFEEIYK